MISLIVESDYGIITDDSKFNRVNHPYLSWCYYTCAIFPCFNKNYV